MGTDRDLVTATKTAIRQAIEFLMSRGLSRDDAYMLVSVACDVNDTQLVDGNVGVHVMIPKAIFTKYTASHVAPPAASPAASHRR
jgi:acetamidase/formamidase